MSKKTVLLIDDEQICIESVEIILDNTNYKLLSASNAVDAIKILDKHYKEISIILLDLMMLDCHGLELLAQMKGNSLFKDIPVVLQTGSNNERDIANGLSMGAISCIYKPYKRAALLATIDQFVKA